MDFTFNGNAQNHVNRDQRYGKLRWRTREESIAEPTGYPDRSSLMVRHIEGLKYRANLQTEQSDYYPEAVEKQQIAPKQNQKIPRKHSRDISVADPNTGHFRFQKQQPPYYGDHRPTVDYCTKQTHLNSVQIDGRVDKLYRSGKLYRTPTKRTSKGSCHGRQATSGTKLTINIRIVD